MPEDQRELLTSNVLRFDVSTAFPRPTEQHLRKALLSFQVIQTSFVDKGRTAEWLIEFRDIREAEAALAILQGTMIEGPHPPCRFKLTGKLNRQLPPPDEDTASLPQYIKTQQPNDLSSRALFNLFRRYGPVIHVNSECHLGKKHPVASIQFLYREDAAQAQRFVKKKHPHKGVLQPYDPCSIICTGLSPSFKKSDFEASFGTYGDIVHSVLVNDGTPNACGIVDFRNAEQALSALFLNGTIVKNTRITVEIHEKDTLAPPNAHHIPAHRPPPSRRRRSPMPNGPRSPPTPIEQSSSPESSPVGPPPPSPPLSPSQNGTSESSTEPVDTRPNGSHQNGHFDTGDDFPSPNARADAGASSDTTSEEEAEPGIVPDTELETEGEAVESAEDGAEVEVEGEAAVEVESDDEVEVESDTGARIEVEADVDVDTDAEVEVETDSEVEDRPKAKVSPNAEAEAEVQDESDVEAEINVEAGGKFGNELDSEDEAEAEPNVDADIELDAEFDVEGDSESSVESDDRDGDVSDSSNDDLNDHTDYTKSTPHEEARSLAQKRFELACAALSDARLARKEALAEELRAKAAREAAEQAEQAAFRAKEEAHRILEEIEDAARQDFVEESRRKMEQIRAEEEEQRKKDQEAREARKAALEAAQRAKEEKEANERRAQEENRQRLKEEAERWAREWVETKKRDEEVRRARMENERKKREQSERKRRAEEERLAREKWEREVKQMKEWEEKERKRQEEKARKEMEELQLKERKEAERQAQTAQVNPHLAASLKELNRCKLRDGAHWPIYKPWDDRCAIERFKLVSEEFDSIKFSESQPLTRLSVPWPVLFAPRDFKVDQLDWDMVEAFFNRAKLILTWAEYKTLVDKAQKRFHPDRWNSRGLGATIYGDEERNVLVEAGKTVSQAINPIWSNSRK